MQSSTEDLRCMAARLAEILGLTGSAVGVRFLPAGAANPAGAVVLEQHRYCQALMRARHGETVLLDGQGIACPAAAAAFGFRPLPEKLQSGKGLVGFGIVMDEAVGRRMFEGMARLEPGSIQSLYLFPLDRAEQWPDVVVMEDEVEKLMWISLAYLNLLRGERVTSSTAVLQATCVDATIIPHLEGRLNQSFGCYGCRDATDIGGNETVLGFPAAVLPEICQQVEYLAAKALPASRAKKAWGALLKREPSTSATER
jgi:uncharacterized protein (DUF169 family)